jgi:hypothetical protein
MNPGKARLLLAELQQALDRLERPTGVRGRAVGVDPQTNRQADAMVEFNVEGEKHRYVVNAKHGMNLSIPSIPSNTG